MWSGVERGAHVPLQLLLLEVQRRVLCEEQGVQVCDEESRRRASSGMYMTFTYGEPRLETTCPDVLILRSNESGSQRPIIVQISCCCRTKGLTSGHDNPAMDLLDGLRKCRGCYCSRCSTAAALTP